MSGNNNWIEEHRGQLNALGHLVAINQRNRQIEQQKEQVTALRAQHVELQRHSQIGEELLEIENSRLDVEKQRYMAEEIDRDRHQEHTNELKQLRNMIAEATVSLERFRKRHLS